MPKQCPPVILVMSILTILVGIGVIGWGILGTLAWGSVLMGASNSSWSTAALLQRTLSLDQEIPFYLYIETGKPVLVLVLGLVAVVAGMGLLGMFPWTRRLAIGYAVATLLLHGSYLTFELGVVRPRVEEQMYYARGVASLASAKPQPTFNVNLIAPAALLMTHALLLLVILVDAGPTFAGQPQGWRTSFAGERPGRSGTPPPGDQAPQPRLEMEALSTSTLLLGVLCLLWGIQGCLLWLPIAWKGRPSEPPPSLRSPNGRVNAAVILPTSRTSTRASALAYAVNDKVFGYIAAETGKALLLVGCGLGALVGGFGLLTLRRWAWWLLTGYAAATILLQFSSLVYYLGLVLPVIHEHSQILWAVAGGYGGNVPGVVIRGEILIPAVLLMTHAVILLVGLHFLKSLTFSRHRLPVDAGPPRRERSAAPEKPRHPQEGIQAEVLDVLPAPPDSAEESPAEKPRRRAPVKSPPAARNPVGWFVGGALAGFVVCAIGGITLWVVYSRFSTASQSSSSQASGYQPTGNRSPSIGIVQPPVNRPASTGVLQPPDNRRPPPVVAQNQTPPPLSPGKFLVEDMRINWFIYTLAFSPDNKTLATSAVATTVSVQPDQWEPIRLWDRDTGQVAGSIKGAGWVGFARNGKALLYYREKGWHMWDLARDLELPQTMEGNYCGLSGDGRVFLTAKEETYRRYNLETARLEATWTGPKFERARAALSRDGSILALGLPSQGAPQLYFTDTGKKVEKTLPEATSLGINTMAFSPKGKELTLAWTVLGEKVCLWTAATPEKVRTLAGSPWGRVTALAFSPDGKTLATGNTQGQVCLWDVDSGATLACSSLQEKDGRILQTYGTEVRAVAFSADGKTLGAAGTRLVKLWELGPNLRHAGQP
ncbi:MAG: hypothetical protein JO112_22185 [Planctomycetes bacterium]|nr:hypothetical protein [Planctomycetota bacterium]